MTGPLYAIGRFCSRHHRPTIAAWVIVAVEDNLPEQAYGSNPLVYEL